MYYGSKLLLFIHKLHCLQTFEHEFTFSHQSLGVCEVSYTYLLGCLRYREKRVKDVCCCLQTCNSVVYVVVKVLALGQSLIVIPTMGVLLYARVISPLLCIMGVNCCCLYINYIVYKCLNI